MRAYRRPTKKQIGVSLAVSLLIHCCLVASWMFGGPTAPAKAFVPDVLVDTPDDPGVTLVLRDEFPPDKPQPKTINTPPSMLPPVVRDIPSETGPPTSPMTQTDVKPAAHQTGSKPTANPLHGRIKAGKSIVYVLDRSSSMSNNEALSRAKEMLLASLQQLSADVSFQIVAYNSGTRTLSTQLQPATPANIERAETWLKSLLAEGRSDHRAGFREALAFKTDAVFLLTDADDLTAAETKAIQALIHQQVVIHAAIYGPQGGATSLLEQFTRTHSGTVRYYVGNQP